MGPKDGLCGRAKPRRNATLLARNVDQGGGAKLAPASQAKGATKFCEKFEDMALTAPQFSRPVNWVIIQYDSRTKLEDVMFFKRQQAQLSNWGSLRGSAWDDKTVEWIAQSDRLDVRVTHIQRTVSFGQSIYGGKDSSESLSTRCDDLPEIYTGKHHVCRR